MMVGLIHSSSISLCAWAPYVVVGRYSQSTVRRFRRWLDNDKIEVHSLYGPLIQRALGGWVETTLYVALDTSMLWYLLHGAFVRGLPGSSRAVGLVCDRAWQCEVA